MLISEIFYSLQGEGQLTGVPSVFVRTSGCNLRCTWCDTPYASWNPEGNEYSISALLSEILSYPQAQHVVITGGEPTIAKDLPLLLKELRNTGKHITIETAGTISPSAFCYDLASISPKLSHSTPDSAKAGAWSAIHEKRRIKIDILRQWCQSPNFQLKFVVSSIEDLNEIEELLEKINLPIPPATILLMPEGINLSTLNQHQQEWIEICKNKGYRLSERMHIQWFGNQRGT
jgi:7-carboxy-7-deazaguanine synthase